MGNFGGLNIIIGEVILVPVVAAYRMLSSVDGFKAILSIKAL